MKKVYLIILDGFGLGQHDPGDAIFHAKKPFLNSLFEKFPMAKLKTHGRAVGLPEFQTGGSEPGHITIGAGRAVKQFLTEINDEIDSGQFFKNEKLKKLFENAKKNGDSAQKNLLRTDGESDSSDEKTSSPKPPNSGRIHFFGLCSDGGIHSFLPHLFGLLKFAKNQEISEIYVHAALDGRDVGERTATEYLAQIEAQKIGKIATLGGRFFGLDRDNNWDRVQKHFDVMTNPTAKVFNENWREYLGEFYKNSTDSDYYAPPVLLDKNGQIRENDVVIFFDFRADRMRQISAAIVNPNFQNFPRAVKIRPENFGVFGKYSDFAAPIFAPKSSGIKNTLGEVVSNLGKTQLRISETEKFNHVTFYFSGERKTEFLGEKRVLIPSPKCASYAEKPEMSAREQTNAAIAELEKNDFTLVVQNFANADLVGHSGKFVAAEKSVEVLDECLAKLIPILRAKKYEIILTADHGNADEMFLANGDPNASHTKNLVPCIVISDGVQKLAETGTLADIAPTALELLEIEKPNEMTGKSLIV